MTLSNSYVPLGTNVATECYC